MLDFLKKILFKKGFQLQRVQLSDFRDIDISPLKAVYKAGGNQVLLNIPVSKCRTQIWHSLEADKNPFVKTLIEWEAGHGEFKESAMDIFYRDFQPKNAAEVLKITKNNVLSQLEPLSFVLPWETSSIKEIRDIRSRDAENENRKYGKKIGLSHGYTEFGPVSDRKGNLEFDRLINIYRSIKKEGYKENLYSEDGSIKGYFVTDSKEWCFIITSGKHRSYALSALGYKKIPISLEMNFKILKNINEYRNWPFVTDKTFTKGEIFDFFNKIIYPSIQ